MKSQKNSLKAKVWFYLILFSFAILTFLWFFQVVSINSFYEWSKRKELTTVVNEVFSAYAKDDFVSSLDKISRDYGVCIEVYSYNQYTYLSNDYGRGCMGDGNLFSLNQYKREFIESNKSVQGYIFSNPKFDNKSYMYALKLNTSEYAFINVSLVPLDSTINILKKQFIYVSMVVLVLSLTIAYFISKKISKPIEKMNKSAKLLAKGNYDITFSTNVDIAEIQELSNTLNQAKDELSKTEALRREFMANVSHDLKTPLTMIRAYAEMVRDLTYKNKQKRDENLNVIIKEADRLNILVNDILELTKIQSKTQPLEMATFELNEFIKGILKQYRIYEEQQEFQFIYSGVENAVVKADLKRIEQVIYNLINNAINYTGKDKKISIIVTDEDPYYRISVKDTGKGIKEEDIPHIWDKYYKVDKNYSRVSIGTGIGLSIVKSILEQHQFPYGVISKRGKGTSFYFLIKKDQG